MLTLSEKYKYKLKKFKKKAKTIMNNEAIC